MKLNELKIGQCARITSVGGEGALRQHFLDMGVIPGAEVTLVKLAPMGDPMELQIHGYELTLRVADAGEITIDPIDERTRKHERPDRIYKSDHPGLGETGKYHAKGDGEKLPEGTKLTFALVGNQNCGKTTLFNQLTGSNQHVGNFPGVTVDCKSGMIKGPAMSSTMSSRTTQAATSVRSMTHQSARARQRNHRAIPTCPSISTHATATSPKNTTRPLRHTSTSSPHATSMRMMRSHRKHISVTCSSSAKRRATGARASTISRRCSTKRGSRMNCGSCRRTVTAVCSIGISPRVRDICRTQLYRNTFRLVELFSS